ncbi:unnamed protein product, partial [Ceratitis capitata]
REKIYEWCADFARQRAWLPCIVWASPTIQLFRRILMSKEKHFSVESRALKDIRACQTSNVYTHFDRTSNINFTITKLQGQ